MQQRRKVCQTPEVAQWREQGIQILGAIRLGSSNTAMFKDRALKQSWEQILKSPKAWPIVRPEKEAMAIG